jgi:DinB superfamily
MSSLRWRRASVYDHPVTAKGLNSKRKVDVFPPVGIAPGADLLSAFQRVDFMTARIKWTERKFDFSFPAELFPEMIERLRGTPVRLEERVGSLPAGVVRQRDGERWSMQENAGHLLDLESLVRQRLDEYLSNASALHAADMTNQKTYEAQHNEVAIASILDGFRDQRLQLVARLDALAPETFARAAHHPRLNVPMRLVDMIYFQAEHDDFHLARISELRRLFGV